MTKKSVAQRLQLARRALINSRFSEAERALRAVLRDEPQNVAAIRDLAQLLNIEGRRWESAPYLFQLVRLRSFSIQDLVLVGNLQEPYEDLPYVKAGLAAVPDDPLPALGLVTSLRRQNKDREALDILRKIVAKYPSQIEAQARLGRILFDLDLENELLRWQAELPAAAEAHPEVWIVRGLWAERNKQLTAAARCFWEAVHRAPNHRLANYRLAVVLNQRNEPEQATAFLRRSELLGNAEQTLFPIYKDGPKMELVEKVADLMQALGRPWEAWAWQVAFLSLQPDDKEAAASHARLRALLDREDPPRTLASANPANRFDLSHFALPRFPERGSKTPRPAKTELPSVEFVDRAEEAGIRFRYFDSWIAANRELMLLETIGGGVAILDYDNDGWPDIYFSQCCRWPVDLDQTTHIDRLFRNMGDGTFRDVTQEAGIQENGYSQGVAVGDIDNDGFPDVYVANVGQNRLYHNNGDGSFTLVPHHRDERVIWTVSAMIADVNGDALPDIYDVNYCAGDDVYTRRCTVDGHPRSCGPKKFDGDVDFLYLNTGDGGWRDVGEESGLHTVAGRGLGILAADFDASGRLELYVTNDVMPNFLFINQSESPGSVPQFTEEGILSGVAVDRAGRQQASMGVTTDDVNGDGLLDLFVGNYYNDNNVLYVQQPGRLFIDQTRDYQLHSPSFWLLTFGAQFLDGDLDGYPDLVIANGHVDDFRFRGEPWRMRPQYFRNEGGTRFVELQGDRAGDYFNKEYLGRGLAIVDWNRDGREDFAVSNIADWASLATNQTARTGHWLAIRLRGTTSSRDAVGARIAVQFGGRTRVRQVIGGSGYEASSQYQRIFGLGSANRVENVTVSWPSGLVQEFFNVPIDGEFILVEGQDEFHRVPLER